MKCNKLAFRWRWWGRAPYGARGLKLLRIGQLPQQLGSRPVWGAWIEMFKRPIYVTIQKVAPRMGRVD